MVEVPHNISLFTRTRRVYVTQGVGEVEGEFQFGICFIWFIIVQLIIPDYTEEVNFQII